MAGYKRKRSASASARGSRYKRRKKGTRKLKTRRQARKYKKKSRNDRMYNFGTLPVLFPERKICRHRGYAQAYFRLDNNFKQETLKLDMMNPFWPRNKSQGTPGVSTMTYDQKYLPRLVEEMANRYVNFRVLGWKVKAQFSTTSPNATPDPIYAFLYIDEFSELVKDWSSGNQQGLLNFTGVKKMLLSDSPYTTHYGILDKGWTHPFVQYFSPKKWFKQEKNVELTHATATYDTGNHVNMAGYDRRPAVHVGAVRDYLSEDRTENKVEVSLMLTFDWIVEWSEPTTTTLQTS